MAFGYYMVSRVDDIPTSTIPITYFGVDCVSRFLNEMRVLSSKLSTVLSKNVLMIEPSSDQLEATDCHLCNKVMCNDRVRNHCHQTGIFLGMAHNGCNLRFKYRRQMNQFLLPIVFHNLKGYDGHLLISELTQKDGNISVIAKSLECYMSFTIGNLKFIDSLNFLSSSLSALVDNCATFPHTMKVYNDKDMLRKGIYPYEYVSDMEILEQKQLPPINAFYSSLTNSGASEEDYSWAQDIWKKFGCSNLKDYTNLYLSCDVLLLCDVFETFRKFSMTQYHLDPAHYISLPSLSWDAMMLFTGVEMEVIKDAEMHLMIEKGKKKIVYCSFLILFH